MYLPVPVPFNLRDRPTAHLTGESIYTADTESRLFTRQVDTWDSVPPESQRFFSVDGLRDMVGMSLEAVMQSAPALETPDYEVLKVRQTKSPLVTWASARQWSGTHGAISVGSIPRQGLGRPRPAENEQVRDSAVRQVHGRVQGYGEREHGVRWGGLQ